VRRRVGRTAQGNVGHLAFSAIWVFSDW